MRNINLKERKIESIDGLFIKNYNDFNSKKKFLKSLNEKWESIKGTYYYKYSNLSEYLLMNSFDNFESMLEQISIRSKRDLDEIILEILEWDDTSNRG